MARAKQTTLAVIGAGIAGLTAARVCQKAGMAVTVYDKGRGVGGRCSTRRRDDFAFDHGAQLIGASSGDFRAALRGWMVSTSVQRWKGRFQGLPSNITPFVGAPGMSTLGKTLARGLSVYLPVTVAKIQPRDGGLWQLRDADDRELGSYDAVLTTCPPAQAQALTGAALSDFIERRAVRMRATWSVMLAFQRPIPTPFDGIVMDGQPLDWAARNNSKPERDVAPDTWVLHAGHDITEAFLDHPREEVVDDLAAAFEHWLDEPLPPLMYSAAHRWLYARAEATGADDDISHFDTDLGLGLAGDWMNPPSSPFLGLQSAWQSGKDAGERIRKWAKKR